MTFSKAALEIISSINLKRVVVEFVVTPTAMIGTWTSILLVLITGSIVGNFILTANTPSLRAQ